MSEQRPWLKNYPQEVPANINADTYPNLISLMEETFKKYGKKSAFSCMGKELTFEQIDKMSVQFGAYLHSFAGGFDHCQYEPTVHPPGDETPVHGFGSEGYCYL